MVHSFLMLGQSNMAGRGRPGDVPPIENENLFMLRNGKWWPLSEPVNYDRPFAGTGLAASFVNAYAEKFGGEAGLIPCADGGSSLDDWSIGGPLYDHAVFQTNLAQRISVVKGILWHQGEADSEVEEKAQTYIPRFLKIINALRQDCGIEKVPVIMGELGAFLEQRPNREIQYFPLVNKALAEIAASQGGFALASADGFVSNGDNLHFDAPSLREFGKRYFQKYLELTA
jgi:hypothetical protein